MFWTDLTARAIPWPALILPLLVIAALQGSIFWLLPAAGVAGVAGLQFSLLRTLAASRRALVAVSSFPLLLLYNLTCAAGLTIGLLHAETRRDRWFVPAVITCAVLIFGFQMAGGAYRAAWMPAIAGLASLALAAALAPFSMYRQAPAGFVEMSRRVTLPERMLISSSATGEGAWIAEVALREMRPSSVITRASKVLVHSDWSGTDYKLLVQSQDQLERRLDELAIDSVIVDTARATDPPPHQALLEEAVWTSPAWKRGEQTGHLVLYRRIRSPAFPRRPRQVDLLDKIGTVIQEP